jgi:nucleoside-diphosphate-sugar epimerase
MNRILITTGNGMFGKALAKELINNKNVIFRLMVRDSIKDNIAYYSKGLLPSPIAWLIRKTQIF